MASEHPARADRVTVRVSTTSGRITIVAEDRSDVDVQGGGHVETEGHRTTITGGTNRLEVRVPVGADLVVGTTSGRVAVRGEAGAVSITTRSAKITVERAASVDARSGSGRIDIAATDGICCVRSRSGSVSVGSCGKADVATEHGRISLEGVQGTVSAHCITGRIDIHMDTADDVIAETVSGRIELSLPRGVRPFVPSATDLDQPIPSDADCTVRARSITGRVEVGNR